MNAEDFKDFCSGGRYEGSKVMLQLKTAGTFTAMLDKRKEILPTMQVMSQREAIMRSAAAQGHELTEDEMRQLPPEDQVTTEIVRPVPILTGILERRENLLLLRYPGVCGTKFIVTILPEDVKHITVAESTRIVT